MYRKKGLKEGGGQVPGPWGQTGVRWLLCLPNLKPEAQLEDSSPKCSILQKYTAIKSRYRLGSSFHLQTAERQCSGKTGIQSPDIKSHEMDLTGTIQRPHGHKESHPEAWSWKSLQGKQSAL